MVVNIDEYDRDWPAKFRWLMPCCLRGSDVMCLKQDVEHMISFRDRAKTLTRPIKRKLIKDIV
jgi:hypothetical protein